MSNLGKMPEYRMIIDRYASYLEVTRDEILRMGIQYDIGSESKEFGQFVYLRDIDATHFHRMKRVTGQSYTVKEMYYDDLSPVDEYRRYYP